MSTRTYSRIYQLLVITLCAINTVSMASVISGTTMNSMMSSGRSSVTTVGPTSNWSIQPMSGIQAGGTRVTLVPSGLAVNVLSRCNNNTISVSFGSTRVNGTLITIGKSMRGIECSSPQFNSTGTQRVEIFCNNESAINTSTTFTYRANPIITSITPRTTIVAGGITQTLIGTDLDAAIKLTLIADDNAHVVQSSCTLSKCYALDSNVSQPCVKCRTGSLSNFLVDIMNNSHIVQPSKSDSVIRNVNVTFSLDGWKYSTSIPVFLNPGVQRFSPDHQDFIVNDGRRLQIAVFWPAFNISSDDVTVELLSLHPTRCGDLRVITSGLSCVPPMMSQQITRYGQADEMKPMVQVTIGYDVTAVGYVTFVVNDSFNVIMSVMIALISFVVLLSVCFGCMTLCHSRLEACCPSCCVDSYDSDRKALAPNGTSSEPSFQTLEEENSGGKSLERSRRRGKAKTYDMSGNGEPGEIGGGKHKSNKAGSIEMVGKVRRDEL